MDPISNVDRIAVLLQQKLRERARATDASRSEKGSGAPERSVSGFEAAQALSAIDGINERQRRRAFIQNILTDQFDPGLVNDPQFQQLVARVSQAIEDDESSSTLLTKLIDDMRKA